MVYITGDCHGDWSRFSSKNFPEQKDMSVRDKDKSIVIVCGDFGIWHDNKEERYWLDWLSNKPFTVCFVDGNHENFDRLYGDEFETVDFHRGKAHKIRHNIYHLIRGHIFDFDGKSFFTFGGASSHDINDGILDRDDFADEREFVQTYRKWDKENKMFRVNHISWWEQELPTQEEMDFGIETLAKNGNKVDYIISHCCPQEVLSIFSMGCYKTDVLTTYFNAIARDNKFTKWFFGHYHDNQQIMGKFIMLYEQIIRII